jgi:NADPH:quinone reductase-like Zn-dependent oxidoreductase
MMSYNAIAWVLYAGDFSSPAPGRLVREEIRLSPIKANEVLAAPIYGCWEANMSHALERSPIDICRYRGEPKVVLGNAGVVRVLETGAGVGTLRPGQHAIISPNGVEDRWGYTVKALGYDSPGQVGALSTLVTLTERQLIPIPEPSKYALPQWAAFSARYVTAWSNWQLAFGVFRLQVSEDDCPSPNVWGWGGGTTLAEVDLARRHGCRVAMLSGQDQNLQMIARLGITPVDRRQFGELSWEEERYRKELDYRRRYIEAETLFIEEVNRLTKNEMVQIFLDYVGGPVYRATLRALSREGVIATAGWKKGMKLSHLRAEECISRHQHIYTHYARHSQSQEAVVYAEATGWMPEKPERIYAFEEVPELVQDYSEGKAGYFPVFSVNPECEAN